MNITLKDVLLVPTFRWITSTVFHVVFNSFVKICCLASSLILFRLHSVGKSCCTSKRFFSSVYQVVPLLLILKHIAYTSTSITYSIILSDQPGQTGFIKSPAQSFGCKGGLTAFLLGTVQLRVVGFLQRLSTLRSWHLPCVLSLASVWAYRLPPHSPLVLPNAQHLPMEHHFSSDPLGAGASSQVHKPQSNRHTAASVSEGSLMLMLLTVKLCLL